MKDVLDNLFGKKDAITNEGEKLEQTEAVVEPVSERDKYPEPIHTEINDGTIEIVTPVETLIENVETASNEAQETVEGNIGIEEIDEPKCEEVDNSTESCIICEIKNVLSKSHGLDFELVELRKSILDILNKYETHCKSKD